MVVFHISSIHVTFFILTIRKGSLRINEPDILKLFVENWDYKSMHTDTSMNKLPFQLRLGYTFVLVGHLIRKASLHAFIALIILQWHLPNNVVNSFFVLFININVFIIEYKTQLWISPRQMVLYFKRDRLDFLKPCDGKANTKKENFDRILSAITSPEFPTMRIAKVTYP